MLKAKHHFFVYPFFQRFTLVKMRRTFHQVNLHGNFEDKNKAVMVIANHVSWWDGFWLMYINLKVLKRKFHFMMLEEQLRKHWYFNLTGGFSVRKSSRSLLESITYARELLQNPNNMVLMFPQGDIQSMHEQNIIFQKGIERILEKSDHTVQLLMIANITDYFSHPKAQLDIYMEEFSGTSFTQDQIQKSYQAFYNRSLEHQKRRANA
jgi:1-acyl-sn-glycerol-3-phosphate acyltransferase